MKSKLFPELHPRMLNSTSFDENIFIIIQIISESVSISIQGNKISSINIVFFTECHTYNIESKPICEHMSFTLTRCMT